jgi:hypothetical protein
MSTDPLSTWLPEVLACEITIASDSINDEARKNLWSFTLTEEEAARISVADVEVFLNAIITSRRQWLLARQFPPGQMRFYFWFDELAGQLRFSLVSDSHGCLPFGRPIFDAAGISQVVRPFLQAANGGLIPWNELQEVSPFGKGTDQDPAIGPLTVWSTSLP